jgi:hypothetical protein
MSSFIVYPVPYSPQCYVEDNDRELGRFLFKLKDVHVIGHKFYLHEKKGKQRIYGAYIKTKQEMKDMSPVLHDEQTITFEPLHELTVGEEYIFDIATLDDLIFDDPLDQWNCRDVHIPWSGKLIKCEPYALVVEKEDKKIEYIDLTLERHYKKVSYLTEEGVSIPVHKF